MNRLNDEIETSVVRPDTNSRWTAFTDKDMNTQMYPLTMISLRTYPYFGPAYSTPTLLINTESGVVRSIGSWLAPEA